ncbi:GatB/GatE catalytic domain-containing protein [Xylariaceae sp. FL0594]|nr:GatB/GatE catalytic domain-containing protein [Xylariaceae sp. FL0594]
MPHFRLTTLSRYLLNGQLRSRGCLHAHKQARPRVSQIRPPCQTSSNAPAVRALHTDTTPETTTPTQSHVPLRKQLKDEAKKQKLSGKKKKANVDNQVVEDWLMTVGIEIHAQLNTAKKLFSSATTSFNDEPNSHVAYFDLATPGSQPIFQKETLIPAIRAALALNCEIQPVSSFDRKHYFHWDQPSGYQITQYYEPFARRGRVILDRSDGIAAEEDEKVIVTIKQVQLEQDTAKTLAQPGDVHWLDFNRVGVPLIEIITDPVFSTPTTAAAFVRKVQSILKSVDACVSGMEAGGLRADVNVSVRSRGEGVPLGQRVEIKNLSSFKAVEDAIIAERDRQIAILKAGGAIAGETRGWSIGSTETRRLRGKEGEVDYRYMPDPDLPPLIIGKDLVSWLDTHKGKLPDQVQEELTRLGLTVKDAKALASLDDGGRVEYFWTVTRLVNRMFDPALNNRDKRGGRSVVNNNPPEPAGDVYQLAANWILHELGRLTSERSDDPSQHLAFSPDGTCERVPAKHLAELLYHLLARDITAKVAKELLWGIYRGHIPDKYSSVEDAIEKEDLYFKELSLEEYGLLADEAVKGQESVLKQFAVAIGPAKPYPHGKLMFLVGRMIRLGKEERIDPKTAEAVMRDRIRGVYVPGLST